MRIGIIQSNYLPWRGYFDFIDSVDLFIFHDDLQYTKGDWRNRNQVKTKTGLAWMSVPVKYHTTAQLIRDTRIEYVTRWQTAHLNRLRANYVKAPYFKDALELFREGVSRRYETISQLNIRLIELVCAYLNIATSLRRSCDYAVSGKKTEKLINLLKKAGGSVYLSGPSAKAYLDEELFRRNQIGLEYKTYDYRPYPQLWGEFAGAVSILDLIANVGPEARSFLKSETPSQVAVLR